MKFLKCWGVSFGIIGIHFFYHLWLSLLWGGALLFYHSPAREVDRYKYLFLSE
jgi:hypothetical protein